MQKDKLNLKPPLRCPHFILRFIPSFQRVCLPSCTRSCTDCAFLMTAFTGPSGKEAITRPGAIPTLLGSKADLRFFCTQAARFEFTFSRSWLLSDASPGWLLSFFNRFDVNWLVWVGGSMGFETSVRLDEESDSCLKNTIKKSQLKQVCSLDRQEHALSFSGIKNSFLSGLFWVKNALSCYHLILLNPASSSLQALD